MTIGTIIEASFRRSFELYRDLVDVLTEEDLVQRLPGLRSNTIGLQLWCVVGARESFAAAIRADRWRGFSCSLTEPSSRGAVTRAIRQSENDLLRELSGISKYSETQNRLLIDLLEHESAHQGQLIRYFYGLELQIPESWKQRYSLSD